MRRSNLNEGTRDEILAELKQLGLDRRIDGDDDKMRAYVNAHTDIEEGAQEVRVRHSVYRVVQDTPDTPDAD